MLMRTFTASVLGLGLSALLPTVAMADRRPDPRDERAPVVRHEDFRDEHRPSFRVEERPEWRRDNDVRVHEEIGRRPERFDRVQVRVEVPPPRLNERVVIPMNEAPDGVIATANHERHGWPIGAIERICQDGTTVYRVTIDRQHQPDLILTIQPDGDLLTRLSA